MGNFNDTPQKEHQTVFLEQILKSNSSKKYIPLPYTPLLGVTLTCGYRIVKFINYHYWRKRQQYLTQSKQNLLRLIFQRKFSDTSYSRIKYKSYYTYIITQKHRLVKRKQKKEKYGLKTLKFSVDCVKIYL